MTPALTALAILLVTWFAVGSAVNVRRGSAALRWLQGGLPRLGARTTVRWLGTSAVQLGLREPRAPFQEVTIIVFLEPRDVPWWPLSHLLGRRDTLIVRAVLRKVPGLELEVVAPRSWSGREVLRRLPLAEWSARGPAEGGLLAACREPAALPRAAELLARAARAGAVLRLSVRPAAPHLQLHVPLPAAGQGASADELFDTVGELAERVSHRGPR